MAKPEWGVKRACLACGTRFYDMQNDPILCPSCGTKFDVESIFRPRRARAPAEQPAPEPAAPMAGNGEDIDEELAALADDSLVEDDEDDEDAAIETSGTSLTTNELFEYVDAWGNPFVYFHAKDYKDVSKVEAYVNFKNEDVTATPMTSEKTGATYPIDFVIEAEDPAQGKRVKFRLRPLRDDPEIAGELGGIAYWEGACDVLDESGKNIGNAAEAMMWSSVISTSRARSWPRFHRVSLSPSTQATLRPDP